MKNVLLKRILITIGIITLFFCIGLTNQNTRKVTFFEAIISDVVTLPGRAVNNIKKWLSIDKASVAKIESLKTENENLRKKNQELEEKLLDYEILASENKILKEKSQFVNLYPDYNIVVASVIFGSSSNWEEIYVIDKGSRDGVLPNMAVITQDGLVGYVESTTDSTAKIVSILDAGNAVSGRSTRTRDAIICKGNISLIDENKIKITSIPLGVEFIESDKIETSGMGGVYPKGIAIGEVEKFITKKNPIENEAILKTYVDFNKLETVAIIISDK